MYRWISTLGMASIAILSGAAFAQTPTYLSKASVASNGPSAVATTPGSLLNPRSDYVVAATPGPKGLRVTAWQDPTQKLALLGHADFADNDAVQVAATGLDPTHVVTAEVGTPGTLSLQVWGIGASGPEGPVASVYGTANTAASNAVSPSLAVTSLSASRFVTVYSNNEQNLEVQAWSVNLATGTLVPLGAPALGGQVDEVAVAQLDASTVVTAVGAPDGSLIVTSWGIDSVGVHYQDQYSVKNGAQSLFQGVAIAAGDVVSLNPPGVYPFEVTTRRAMTTTINAAGNLEVIEWELSAAGKWSLSKNSVVPAVPTGDIVTATAATFLPTGIPISVSSDVFTTVYLGGYKRSDDASYAATTDGVHDGLTALAATTAGTDFNVLNPFAQVHAFFATAALTYPDGDQANGGNFEIRTWSYPIDPPLR